MFTLGICGTNVLPCPARHTAIQTLNHSLSCSLLIGMTLTKEPFGDERLSHLLLPSAPPFVLNKTLPADLLSFSYLTEIVDEQAAASGLQDSREIRKMII